LIGEYNPRNNLSVDFRAFPYRTAKLTNETRAMVQGFGFGNLYSRLIVGMQPKVNYRAIQGNVQCTYYSQSGKYTRVMHAALLGKWNSWKIHKKEIN
jgi:hypothetical protein